MGASISVNKVVKIPTAKQAEEKLLRSIATALRKRVIESKKEDRRTNQRIRKAIKDELPLYLVEVSEGIAESITRQRRAYTQHFNATPEGSALRDAITKKLTPKGYTLHMSYCAGGRGDVDDPGRPPFYELQISW